MKKLLVLLAGAGLIGASPITLNSWTQLADSTLNNAPATRYTAINAGGLAVGGLCVGGDFTHCATSGGAVAGDTLTFTLGSAANINILLQDYFQVGDVYEVVLYNGASTAIGHWESSAVSLNGATAQSCWNGSPGVQNNSCLNANTGVLAAGNYSITVWDILLSYVGTATADPFGGGTVSTAYTPSSFLLALDTVPEPGTFALLGLGGVALGLFRRRSAQ